MMFAGWAECPECGVLGYSSTHECNEKMLHHHQVKQHTWSGEWETTVAGEGREAKPLYVWSLYDLWMTTPRGKFAQYLATH